MLREISQNRLLTTYGHLSLDYAKIVVARSSWLGAKPREKYQLVANGMAPE